MPRKGYKQTIEHRKKLSKARKKRVGKLAPNWKNGEIKVGDGYIQVYSPNHPYKSKLGNSKGYVLKHRLVMEKHLGRYLLPTEVVDHKNGIKSDNKIENLVLFDNNSDHIREEHTRGRFQMTDKWRENISKARKKDYHNRKRDSLGRFI